MPLVPVDNDPFAAAPPAPAGAFVPVDHDPFAGAASAAPAAPPAEAPVQPPEEPGFFNHPGKSLAYGTQAVGRGLADVAGAPGDLANFAANALLSIASGASGVVGGPKIDFRFGESPVGSNAIKSAASSAAEAAGVPLVDRNEMPAAQNVLYDIERGGTAAGVGSAALAARAPALVAKEALGARANPNVLDALVKPYTSGSVRPVIGDVAGGAGAQVATEAANDIPDGPMKTAATILAPLAGGVGGVTLSEIGQGIPRMVADAVKRRVTDPNVGFDPLTGNTFSKAETEQAARQYQSAAAAQATTKAEAEALPEAARQNIQERVNELRAENLPVPTTGLTSDNIGLAGLEARQRAGNRAPFIARDEAVKAAAGEKVRSLRPEDADPMAARQLAEQQANQRMTGVRQQADDAAQAALDAEAVRQQQAATVAPLAGQTAKNDASRRLHTNIVDEGYLPARTEKNRQFDEAPGRVEEVPTDDVRAAAQRVRENINALGPQAQQLPAEFVQRIEGLVGDDGNVRPVTGGEVADVRKYLSTAYEQAQRSGNFDLADNIGTLRQAINRTIEGAPGYAEANTNYRKFAETYRPSRTDEAANFTREIDRGANPPPSETADRFLAGPEKVASLRRMIGASANPQAGNQAVRDRLLGEVASVGLNSNGTLNWRAVSTWARKNSETLSAFPEASKEVNDLIASARSGETLSTKAKTRLRDAERAIGETQREIDQSATGFLIGRDPKIAARRALSSDDPEGTIREISELVKANPKAAAGWKAAMADALHDRVTSTMPDSGDPSTFATTYAKLTNEMKRNEKALSQVFSPEEMNSLRQAHKLLKSFTNMGKAALPGSQTAERLGQGFMGKVEMAVRLHYGALEGGSVMRKIRLLTSNLPNNQASVQRLMELASTDPDVAMYLLGRKTRDFDVPAANSRLQKLVMGTDVARENNEPDGPITISVPPRKVGP
jgi:hypothetical protein